MQLDLFLQICRHFVSDERRNVRKNKSSFQCLCYFFLCSNTVYAFFFFLDEPRPSQSHKQLIHISEFGYIVVFVPQIELHRWVRSLPPAALAWERPAAHPTVSCRTTCTRLTVLSRPLSLVAPLQLCQSLSVSPRPKLFDLTLTSPPTYTTSWPTVRTTSPPATWWTTPACSAANPWCRPAPWDWKVRWGQHLIVTLESGMLSDCAVRVVQLTVYNYRGGPCYRCLYPVPPPPETVTNCSDGGVLGVGELCLIVCPRNYVSCENREIVVKWFPFFEKKKKKSSRNNGLLSSFRSPQDSSWKSLYPFHSACFQTVPFCVLSPYTRNFPAKSCDCATKELPEGLSIEPC